MADPTDNDAEQRDDEHYATESGDPHEEPVPEEIDPPHDPDDEHYAPES